VTDRKAIIREAAYGTVIEVFEWLSQEAINNAHQNLAVLQMWAEYAEVCECVQPNTLAEDNNMFAAFTPID
jgi:hypothetical protein